MVALEWDSIKCRSGGCDLRRYDGLCLGSIWCDRKDRPFAKDADTREIWVCQESWLMLGPDAQNLWMLGDVCRSTMACKMYMETPTRRERSRSRTRRAVAPLIFV